MENEGFDGYLPLRAQRVAPGEWRITDKRNNVLCYLEGAALAEWICNQVNNSAQARAQAFEECRSLFDTMLNAAQTLRIQQSQATVTWEQHYKDKGDAAWRTINEAHQQAIEAASHKEGAAQPAVATFAPGCECGNCKEARAREQAK